MHNFLAHIKNYALLSPEAQEAMQSCFEEITVYKNQLLVKEGQICRNLYFVQNGALRGFYNLDGKEITHWFSFENDFVTSFHSFITQKAAVENIQAIETTTLFSISKEKLTQLFDQFHETERLVRIIYEKYYIRLEERFVNAQFKKAKERYEQLIQDSPQMLNRVPLGYIAAYLGISQETLIRIRGRL